MHHDLTTFDLDEYVYEALARGGERVPAQGRSGRTTWPRRSGWWPRGDALLAPRITRRLIAEFSRQRRPPCRPG